MNKAKLIIYSSSVGQDGVGSLAKTIYNGLGSNYEVSIIKTDGIVSTVKSISRFHQEKSLVLPGKGVLIIALLRFLGVCDTRNMIIIVDTRIPQLENVGFIKKLKLDLSNLSYSFLNKRSSGVIYSYKKALINRGRRFSGIRETIIYHPTYATETCQERSNIYDFAWIGRLTTNKNPLMFLEALDRLSSPKKLEVAILGKGPLKALLLSHRIFDSSRFNITYIDSLDDVSSLYCKTKVVVSTSLIEGCSMVLKEALKAGCIIVAPDTNSMGPKDLVEQYGGHLFQPGNLDELVIGLKGASSSLTNNGTNVISNELSFKKYTDFFEDSL